LIYDWSPSSKANSALAIRRNDSFQLRMIKVEINRGVCLSQHLRERMT